MPIVIPDTVDFSSYLEGPEEDAHVRSPLQYAEEVKKLFRSDEQSGLMLPWQSTQEFLRVRPGEVTIWAGINGHGKTLLLSQVKLFLMAQGARVCEASMEMKPHRTLHRAVQQAGCTTNPSDEYIDQFTEWCDGKLYLYDQQGMVSPDRIIAVSRYAQRELGCTQMLIDSMMKCGISSVDFDGQKNFIAQLCAHAMDTGMHVHLVAHSRKGESELDRIGKFEVKGASEIIDQVDNLNLVWRNKRKEERLRIDPNDAEAMEMCDAILSNEKQRNGRPGDERSYALFLDRKSISFTDRRGKHCVPLAIDGKPVSSITETGMMEVPF